MTMFPFKTRRAFPRRHALICQAALSSFDALPQATIHHASHCGNSCWSQQSLVERLVTPFHPPHAFLLYSPILLPANWSPIAGHEHLHSSQALSPSTQWLDLYAITSDLGDSCSNLSSSLYFAGVILKVSLPVTALHFNRGQWVILSFVVDF